MEALIPALNGVFVLIMTLVLTWYIRDRFAEFNTRFAELKQEIADQKRETAARFAEVRQELRELRAAVDALRSDVTRIALAVGAQPRPDTA